MTFSLDKEKLDKEYGLRLPLLGALKEEAVHEITHALKAEEFKFHSVTARIKTLDSIFLKAEAKELETPLDSMPDIVGTRIVALFLGDIEKIAQLLKKTFDVHFVDDKIEDGDLSKFGYLSVHIHAKFKSSFSGTRYDHIKNVLFEIQIRTIAMDAWASASHYLDYKSEQDIPTDLKRDFHALSGLFYVADKHFEMFFRSRQRSVQEVRTLSRSNDFLNHEINLDTLSEYLLKRYSDREEPTSTQISKLVTSLKEAGLASLGDLEIALDKKASYLEKREKESYPKGGQFNRVGAVRVSFADDPLFEPEVIRPQLPNFAKLVKAARTPSRKPQDPA